MGLKIEQIFPKGFQPNVSKWSREAGFVSISRLSCGAIHRSCSIQCIRPLAHSHGSPISNLIVALFGLHQAFLTKDIKKSVFCCCMYTFVSVTQVIFLQANEFSLKNYKNGHEIFFGLSIVLELKVGAYYSNNRYQQMTI